MTPIGIGIAIMLAALGLTIVYAVTRAQARAQRRPLRGKGRDHKKG